MITALSYLTDAMPLLSDPARVLRFARASSVETLQQLPRLLTRVLTSMSPVRVVLALVLASACVTHAAPLTRVGDPIAIERAASVSFSPDAPAARANSVAYIAGGNALRALTLDATPRLVTLADVSDVGPCERVFAYESSRKDLDSKARTRLGVTCTATNSFLIYAVDASGKSAKRIQEMKNVDRIANPRDVVVLNDTLAFIASGTHARVVAARLDPSEREAPSLVASTFQLSGVDALRLGSTSRQTIRVMSGATRRVTTLRYTPAGTLQLVGSVKDSRLDGASGVCAGNGDGNYTFVVSPVNGGTFAVFNSSKFGAPEFLSGIHANAGFDDGFDESPSNAADLQGAHHVSVRGNDAYVASKSLGAIVIVDVTDPSKPVVRDKLQSPELAGVDHVFASPDGAFVVALVNATSDGPSSLVVASADDAIISQIPKRRRSQRR